MKAIIDSGSTKADFVFVGKDRKIIQLKTVGFNPLATDYQPFIDSYINHPDRPTESVQEVFFYGAGCSTEQAISTAKEVLSQLFPEAKIQVQDDLLGAARATSQGKASMVAILGTGSNSCLFNGTKIIDHVSNLGYLLGDEGGGFAIGKEVLRSFFYRELPPELTIAFQDQYQLSRNQLIQRIYQSKAPNREIAAFAEFAVAHRSNPAIKKLVANVFQEFIDRNLKKYQVTTSIPVHFIGSISYIFRNRIEEILEQNHLLPGVFLRKPIDGLIEFHS